MKLRHIHGQGYQFMSGGLYFEHDQYGFLWICAVVGTATGQKYPYPSLQPFFSKTSVAAETNIFVASSIGRFNFTPAACW